MNNDFFSFEILITVIMTMQLWIVSNCVDYFTIAQLPGTFQHVEVFPHADVSIDKWIIFNNDYIFKWYKSLNTALFNDINKLVPYMILKKNSIIKYVLECDCF